MLTHSQLSMHKATGPRPRLLRPPCGWTLSTDGRGVERMFAFDLLALAVQFCRLLAGIAAITGYRPVIRVVGRVVRIVVPTEDGVLPREGRGLIRGIGSLLRRLEPLRKAAQAGARPARAAAAAAGRGR